MKRHGAGDRGRTGNVQLAKLLSNNMPLLDRGIAPGLNQNKCSPPLGNTCYGLEPEVSVMG